MSVSIESLESRTMLAATVARPAFNTGTGFYVVGNDVYDANGEQFVMRGFNHTTWWGDGNKNLLAIDQFSKTKANTVRAVFGTGFGPSQTPAQRQDIAERYIKNGIVPVVEDHMATVLYDKASLDAVVDRWLDPANVAWLKKDEKYVILNIANEWGPDSELWRDAYISNIQRIRAAGINALLMVDAGLKGQSIHTIETWANEIQAADPQHNVVFSIHMYEFWRSGNPEDVGTVDPETGLPWDVATEMQKVSDAGIPLVCGEFSWNEAEFVTYDTRSAMQTFNDLGMGWLAWSWNQNDDTRLNMLANNTAYQYNSSADLSDFGKLIIDDPTLGLKATSKQASIFTAPPPPPVLTGSIQGVCFGDSNANAKFDAGEPVADARTVFIDSDNDGILDPGEKLLLTDGAGKFQFNGLVAGTYHIRRVFPAGYVSSTPLVDITLTAGQVATGLLIGSKSSKPTPPPAGSGSISGFCFADLNKNGKFDGSDSKQPGKTVFIDANNDGILQSTEKSMATDGSGAFKFAGLSAGTYIVRRVMPSGYKLTTALLKPVLSAGQNLVGLGIGSIKV